MIWSWLEGCRRSGWALEDLVSCRPFLSFDLVVGLVIEDACFSLHPYSHLRLFT